MVFYNEDKDEKKIFVECSCRTHGFEVSRFKDDDTVYLSLYTSNFYFKQDKFFARLWKKVKNIFSIIRGKEYRLDETVLTLEEVDGFIKALEKMKVVDENEKSK